MKKLNAAWTAGKFVGAGGWKREVRSPARRDGAKDAHKKAAKKRSAPKGKMKKRVPIGIMTQEKGRMI